MSGWVRGRKRQIVTPVDGVVVISIILAKVPVVVDHCISDAF